MDDRARKISNELAFSEKRFTHLIRLMFIATVLSGVTAGCSENNTDIVSFLKAHEHVVSGNDYVLAPPDVITIHAPVSPEVNDTTYQINPEGKITTKLLGDIKVAGLTSKESASKIQALLDRYYVDPEVAVEVRAYNSRNIYVFGEVGNRGVYPYTGRDTLLNVLARAQPTFLAWRSKIEVIRPDPVTEQRKKLVIDLDEMIRSGDPTMNVLLQEGDTVYVPPTPLAWIGLRVRELLFPVSPALNAYTAPASAVAATDTYQGNNDNNNNNNGRGRITLLRR